MELFIPEIVTAGLGSLATFGIVAYAERGHKRNNPWLTPPNSPRTSKRPRLDTQTVGPAMPRVARRKRFSRRRFGKRRVNRRTRRVTKRKGTFKRKVKAVLLRTLETFKKHYTETSFTLAPGNATTGMNVRIFAPWQAAFTQGTGSGQIHGSKVHLWKYMLRLNMRGLVAGDVHVQIIFFKSDFQMDTTAAGTDLNDEGQNMSPTTTTVTNPTQVAPNGNIPLFDVTASPGQFAGLSPVTKWNNDNISILKIWNYKMHGFGVATTDPFIDTTITMKFNKQVQIQETQETIDGVPRFFGPTGKRGHADQYYYAIRTWTQDPISSTSAVSVLHRGNLMWKEI
nr:capsid protein [robinz virus RP_382]